MLLAVLCGCSVPISYAPAGSTVPPRPSPSPEVSSTSPEGMLSRLALLEIKGRAPKTGYSRDLFGEGWSDVDGDGCDTRDDILRRDAVESTFRMGCVDQVVVEDPFSGARLTVRSEIDIDHVVPLSDAWQKGAQAFTPEVRELFANDPANLIAVDGDLNSAKGDSDAATWLPPNRGFWCEYIGLQIEVKVAYGLWVTQAEYDAMSRVLADCPA